MVLLGFHELGMRFVGSGLRGGARESMGEIYEDS